MIVQNDPTTLEMIGATAPRLRRDDVRSAATCVAVLSDTGRVALVSDVFVETIGLDDATQIIGRSWCKTWPADAHAPLTVALNRAWRGIVSTYWARSPNAEGLSVDWDIRISPIFDEAGDVASVLAVSRPVTKH